MQKKINYFIWGFIVVLIIFFTSLLLINKDKIKEYKFSTNKPYNIDVRIYLKDNQLGQKYIKQLKNIKISSKDKYLNNLVSYLNTNKIDRYLIQVNNDVLVGNHYGNDLYKVATYYQDNSLFKILSVTNKYILTEDYQESNYDRIIIIGDKKRVEEVNNVFKNISSLDLQKEAVKKMEDIEIYWLKDQEVINHQMTNNHQSNKK